MPQGAGSHAVRGGALGLGAGRGTAVGGTTESVRAKGRTQWPIAGLGGVGGGVWNLEEELEQVEGGALGSETEGVRSQALGVGLQPGSGVAPVQETKSNISEGVATVFWLGVGWPVPTET